MQNQMLLELGASWVSSNELMWRLGGRTGLAAQIPKAAWSLRKRGLVEVERRKLADFDEVVRVFPSKTHDPAVKQMREDLLPTLAKYKPRRDPRYARGKHENHQVRQNVHVAGFGSRWSALEKRLIGHIAGAAANKLDAALPVVWRARQLLGIDTHVQDDRSLRWLVEEAANAWGTEIPAIFVEVRAFCDELLPATDAVELRSVLHELVDMNRSGSTVLSIDARMFLLQRAREYLVKMRNHREASVRGRGFGTASLREHAERTHFAPVIHQLLTRKVLETYLFVRLTDAGREKRIALLSATNDMKIS